MGVAAFEAVASAPRVAEAVDGQDVAVRVAVHVDRQERNSLAARAVYRRRLERQRAPRARHHRGPSRRELVVAVVEVDVAEQHALLVDHRA